MDSVYPMSIGWANLQPVLQPSAEQQTEIDQQIAAMDLPELDESDKVAEEMAAGYAAYVASEEAGDKHRQVASSPTKNPPVQAPAAAVPAAVAATEVGATSVVNGLLSATAAMASGVPAHSNAGLSPLVRNARRMEGRQAVATAAALVSAQAILQLMYTQDTPALD